MPSDAYDIIKLPGVYRLEVDDKPIELSSEKGQMTAKYACEILQIIEAEGFEYTFGGYSTFAGIKSEEFHALRLAYLLAAYELADFLGYVHPLPLIRSPR